MDGGLALVPVLPEWILYLFISIISEIATINQHFPVISEVSNMDEAVSSRADFSLLSPEWFMAQSFSLTFLQVNYYYCCT